MPELDPPGVLRLRPGERQELHSYNMAEAVADPRPNEWAEVLEGRVAVFHDGRFHRVARAGDPIGFFRADFGLIELVGIEHSRVRQFDYDTLVDEQPDEAARLRELFFVEAADLRRRRRRLELGLAGYLARPGARIMPGPYHSRDVRMDCFLLDLKEPVEVPPGMVRIFERRALMVAARFPMFGTAERVVDPFVYAEVALFIPIVHPARGPALYCPELRPDNLMALLTGREMQGFPKRFAQAVMTEDDGLTLVMADEVRQDIRFARERVAEDVWVREIAAALWPDQKIGRFSGALGRVVTRLVGVDALLLLAPRLPIVVRHGRPGAGGLPAIDELRGVPFRFDPDRRDEPVGLPRFASPRDFQRLSRIRAQHLGAGWYPGEVLGGWSITLDLELGEARRLGLEGLFRQVVEVLRRPAPWQQAVQLPDSGGLAPEPVDGGLLLQPRARLELDGELATELKSGRVALFEGDVFVDIVDAPCRLEDAPPLVLDGARLKRWIEAVDVSTVIQAPRSPTPDEDSLKARVRWTRADSLVLDRFRHGDERLYEEGPDAVLLEGSEEGPSALEIWALRGPQTPFEADALPPVLTPLRRYLIIEEYETGQAIERAGGLYCLCSHPRLGRVLACVERWVDVPGRLLIARERLCQPARWGHFRERPWTEDLGMSGWNPSRELFLLLDGRLQLRTHRKMVGGSVSGSGLLGVPFGNQTLTVASWWQVHGFRAGPPLRRIVMNALQFSPGRAFWLRSPTLEPLSEHWVGQSVQAAIRVEGHSKWIPGREHDQDAGRMGHPWRLRRHR